MAEMADNKESGEMSCKKKAILFGGSDGHGITMTVISERALQQQGFTVKTVCYKRECSVSEGQESDDCGTMIPEYFWAFTFKNWNYTGMGPGDIVMVVDIPLPVPFRLPRVDAAGEGLKKIEELAKKKIRVILVDHHKRTLDRYAEAIEKGAEVRFSVGPEQYSHYGIPDDHALFWGTVGAVCDRDVSILPVEDDEKTRFGEYERFAAWIDHDKWTLTQDDQSLIKKIRDNVYKPNEGWPKISDYNATEEGSVAYIRSLTSNKGFKQLDDACRYRKNTRYGVGIGHDDSYILVINYWRNHWVEHDITYPVVLKFPNRLDMAGHDSGPIWKVKQGVDAEEEAKKIIGVLNDCNKTDPGDNTEDTDVVDFFIRAISESSKKIPGFLTIHGWLHVETVIANARLLGKLYGLDDNEQKILEWAALFHDLGNSAAGYKDIPSFQTLMKDNNLDMDVFNDDDGRKVRDNHHILTKCILLYEKEHGYLKGRIPGLFSEEDFQTILMLCKYHRKGALPQTTDINKKLCSLLRIADGLDKTKSRARINDKWERWSDIRKKFEAIINNNDSSEEDKKNARDSINHWEGQRAVESIRLSLLKQGNKNHITFEFLISDTIKAKFMLQDFCKELRFIEDPDVAWSVVACNILKCGEPCKTCCESTLRNA